MSIEGLLGRKLGTLQLFDEEGQLHGATAVEVGPCYVTQIRTPEKDGYSAVQLGFGTAKRQTRGMEGHLKAGGQPQLRHLGEFKADDTNEFEVGQAVGSDLFETGDLVHVTGTSKGRGFQGGVKRHGFRGGPRTHGQSDRHRAPGSIGAGTTPGRVLKGTRMSGHMGARRSTVRNLVVLGRNDEKSVIFVGGSVPGPRGGLVRVRVARRAAK
ncbi:MAG: 50S ribosomal protein L3 [Dehalococcoidia bacterium]